LEKRMETSGTSLQKNFTQGMEEILAVARTPEENTRKEAEESLRILPSQPFFKMIDENAIFSPEQAASLLHRKPLSVHLDKKTTDDATFKMESDRKSKEEKEQELKAKQALTIEKNELLSNKRWKFVFTDVNPVIDIAKRQVLVREPDGTLRNATALERAKQL